MIFSAIPFGRLTMSLILFSTVISVGLLLLFNWLAKKKDGIAKACWTSACLTVVWAFLFSAALCLQCLITFGWSLVCLLTPKYPTVFRYGSMVAVVASYIVMLWPGVAELGEIHRLRQDFPLESLSDRLVYEHQVRPAETSQESAPALVLSPAVEKRLAEELTGDRSNYRRYSLMALHDRTRDDFVLARGFGPVRMRSLRAENIELPQPAPIPFNAPLDDRPAYDPETGSALAEVADVPGVPFPHSEELLQMHYAGLGDFFSAERMGYIQDVQHVAGFQSHGFTKMPHFEGEGRTTSWKIAQLELVSLLKHEQPVAYVSAYLPQMDQLKDVVTRPLNDFEEDAISRLRTDEDVVIHDAGNHIQMVGSLRASKNCLQCHAVPRGELLGAMTYRLVPAGTTARVDEGKHP